MNKKPVTRVEDNKSEDSAFGEDSPATMIWNSIKEVEIQMFGLPNQRVADYCKPVTVEPSKLYLVSKASAVLPSLEEALKKSHNVEMADKYIIVTKK